MYSHPKTVALILAGGSGSRMKMAQPKQWTEICAKPLLCYSLEAFEQSSRIDGIIVVCRDNDDKRIKELCQRYRITKLYAIKHGGQTRQQSVMNGIEALEHDVKYIAIHDSARPLVTVSDIDMVCDTAYISGAAIATHPMTDTVKQISPNAIITSTLDRDKLVRAATPQVFDKEKYIRSALKLYSEGALVTDDSMVFELVGYPVTAVLCSGANIKVTFPEDAEYVEYIINQRNTGNKCEAEMRIGHGYDVHRLVEGRSLIVGGVNIEYPKGLLGHSDADVLAHAVADALLGACGLPDIGKLFPDTDIKYKDADSMVLLGHVARYIFDAGYNIVNIDATVVAQAPKFAPYISDMKKNISAALGCAPEQVGVKATTEEKLGFTGSGEGIAAHAVALVSKRRS